MIGQESIINKIKDLYQGKGLPKFILLEGEEGCGKKTLCKEISKLTGYDIVFFDNKIDDIRECIELAYTQKSPIIYVLRNADSMSLAAKNSILKLVEEPPLNAYIIMLIENCDNTLKTILSRAFLIKMEPYTVNQLQQYLNAKQTALTDDEQQRVINICTTPGMINKLLEINTIELLDFCDSVINNLGKVSVSNALKIPKKIKLTESGEGWDINLFLNCLAYSNRINANKDNIKRNSLFGQFIAVAKHNISNASINKLYILDGLIMDGWLIWNCGN